MNTQTTDNLFLGDEAREKLMRGITRAAEVVGATMGTSGQNGLVEAPVQPFHFFTNDGATLLGSMRFADPLEEMGRQILFEAVNRSNRAQGDGSSTTAVLTASILQEGMKHLKETSPMEIKRSLEACIPHIEESIRKQTKKIVSDDGKVIDLVRLEQVATISAEDETIGKMIAEIYGKIGVDGIVSWDVSKTPDDHYTLSNGLTIQGATLANPYMGDLIGPNVFAKEATVKNPNIILCRQKITTAQDFEIIFPYLYQKGIKDAVIFCDEIETSAILQLLMTQQKQDFRTVVVQMPILWREEWWEDLALASGGTIISAASGINLRDIEENHLGHFDSIKVGKEETFIDGIQSLRKHIAQLKVSGDDASLIRASRLNTKTARYFVGGNSDSAIHYRLLKLEDSLSSASSALEHGIVPGGGVALLNASEDIGNSILEEALRIPYRQIYKNANTQNIIKRKERSEGFDSRTGKVVDMFEQGIVDSADVVMSAVRSAVGVAAGILTIGSVILLPPAPEQPNQMMPPITR
jgi:chaperonin GroEL